MEGRLPGGVPGECRLEARAWLPAKVPAKVGCVGKIGREGTCKSAREGNMRLCAFGPHVAALGEMWVPFHALQV